jgi:hypothetical protein
MKATSEQVEGGASRRIDPRNYFDIGEVSILRAYFGLKLRKSDPPLASLYEAEGDDGERVGPIRLSRHVGDEGTVSAISHAVARICLADVQDRLPQWAAVDSMGNTLLGRPEFKHQQRLLPLEPEGLLCINWADSGPGYSWPEDYHVTHLPGFHRYVVTASTDSPDAHGVTDWAIGWFSGRADAVKSSRRLIARWWRSLMNDCDQGKWEYLFHEGLLDETWAKRTRARVWRGHGY